MTRTVSRASQRRRRPSRDETEPLLVKQADRPNPLPKAQLAVVYAIKLTLPIAITHLLPYYNVLIERLAASEGADTGYYSGVVVCTLRLTKSTMLTCAGGTQHSAFAIAQFISMYGWGWLSGEISSLRACTLLWHSCIPHR